MKENVGISKNRKIMFDANSLSMGSLTGYLFIAPALIALLALVVYPLVYGFYISFFDTNFANKWNFVGLNNYIRIFSNTSFLKQLWLTVKFTLIVVAAHFVIGTFLALLLNNKPKGNTFFRAVLILPWLLPEVVVALLFKWIMNPLYGILNYFLQITGISNTNISWLGEAKFAFIAVVLVAIWKGYPLVMVNVLAGLQSIPQEIYEASEVDGANKIQTLFYITLPSIKPILATVLILDSVWWFKHYTIIALLTQGGPGNSTAIVSIDIYKQAFEFFNFGRAAAMSVIVFFVCLLIGKLYRRYLEND